MFCPQCGNSVDPNMNFCPYCSFSLKNIKNTNQRPSNEGNNTYNQKVDNFQENQQQRQYAQKQSLPSFDRYRQQISNNNQPVQQRPQDNVPPTGGHGDYYPPYNNDYNQQPNTGNENYNQRYNDNIQRPSRNNENEHYDYPKSGYNSQNTPQNNQGYNEERERIENQKKYNDQSYGQINYQATPQVEQSNYNQNLPPQPKNDFSSNKEEQSWRTSQQKQQYPNFDDENKKVSKNIYSSKNQRTSSKRSPLIPPDEYQEETVFNQGRQRNQEADHDDFDVYDYEERDYSQPRFYNRMWFIVLMIILLLLATSVLMHFLKIIDLSKIPEYFNNIIGGSSQEEQTSSSSEEETSSSEETSSQSNSTESESSADSESSEEESKGNNDKNFYIDITNIEEKHKDKLYKLGDKIEIEGVIYIITIDDDKNIKSDNDEYVIINLDITNNSSDILMVNPFCFTLIDGNSKVYSPSFKNSGSIPVEEVSSNKKLTGSISYKIPIDTKSVFIAFSNSENLDEAEFFIKYR